MKQNKITTSVLYSINEISFSFIDRRGKRKIKGKKEKGEGKASE